MPSISTSNSSDDGVNSFEKEKAAQSHQWTVATALIRMFIAIAMRVQHMELGQKKENNVNQLKEKGNNYNQQSSQLLQGKATTIATCTHTCTIAQPHSQQASSSSATCLSTGNNESTTTYLLLKSFGNWACTIRSAFHFICNKTIHAPFFSSISASNWSGWQFTSMECFNVSWFNSCLVHELSVSLLELLLEQCCSSVGGSSSWSSWR